MTTAPLTDRLVVRSRLVQGGTELLDMLPSPVGVLSWVRAGEGLVAWGEVARVCTEGPDRFARAQQWWQSFCARLDTRDEVGLSGSGPIAFASLAFDDSPDVESARSVLKREYANGTVDAIIAEFDRLENAA